MKVFSTSKIDLLKALRWLLVILLIAMFSFSAFNKISANPSSIEVFKQIGVGQWLRYFTAFVEICGIVALLMNRLRKWGVMLFWGICCGALAAQLGPLKGDIVHVLILFSIVGCTLLVDMRLNRSN